MTGFEPATPTTPLWYATGLRYIPNYCITTKRTLDNTDPATLPPMPGYATKIPLSAGLHPELFCRLTNLADL